MAITLNGTTGISSPGGDTSTSLATTNLSYTGTLTGGTGVIAIGTNQIYKDSSGNVGVGTASPSVKLHVSGGNAWVINSAASCRLLVGQGTSANQYGYIQWNYTNTTLDIRSQSNPIVFGTDATDWMRLDASGNLGLGVTPNSGWITGGTFENQGGGIWSNAPSVNYYLQNAYFGASNVWRYRSSNPACMYHQYLGNHYWNIAPSGTAGNAISFTQAMTLDSSGALIIGDTVTTGTPTKGFTALINGGSSYFSIGHITGTGSGTGYMQFIYNGGLIGSITQNGTTGVLYNITSDQRLKENIVDAPNALDSVNAIKVRSFDWKSDGSHAEYGYIAQELLEVAPEAVHTPADPEEMMGVDFGKLTPRLVKAIQELTTRLEALEAK